MAQEQHVWNTRQPPEEVAVICKTGDGCPRLPTGVPNYFFIFSPVHLLQGGFNILTQLCSDTVC